MRVFESGSRQAPALVLLHSIATHSALWSAQTPIWSQRYRVLSVDLPGHGTSPPAANVNTLDKYALELQTLLGAYGIERCAIVGLSLGGMIGQAFALRFPDRLSALVLANTSATTPPVMQERWQERKQQALAAGMESQVAATLERWFTPEFAASRPLTIEWVTQMIRSTHPEGYGAAIEAIRSSDLLDQLGGIQAPALLLAGSRDGATTVQIMEKLAQRIAGARFQVLADAGHISNVSNPTDFTESVGAFLHELRL